MREGVCFNVRYQLLNCSNKFVSTLMLFKTLDCSNKFVITSNAFSLADERREKGDIAILSLSSIEAGRG